MNVLNDEEQNEFFEKHLPHRLNLLLTLRNRREYLFTEKNHGDIYRCVKDSNLIAVRLFMDFLCLKGEEKDKEYFLRPNTSERSTDVKIDKFIGRKLIVDDVPEFMRRTLAGVYVRGDKELAHITNIFNEEFNTEEKLIEAANSIEYLIKKFLYNDPQIVKEFPELKPGGYY